MKRHFDFLILGSGFAGSLLAMALRRQGRSVLLIDKSRHPRFAIGESTTPMTNLLLEQFARKWDLPQVLPLTRWGTWHKALPLTAGGLKRGFTFYHHERSRPFRDDASRAHQLLVAASPNEAIADTHWHRAHVDAYLASTARSMGAELMEATSLVNLAFDPALFHARHHAELKTAMGEELHVECRWVIDASGPRGALHRLLQHEEAPSTSLPPTSTVFAHFENVSRSASMPEYQSSETPPYAPDDAAVHHVFDGGWIWVLRFSSGITSAGAALGPRWQSIFDVTAPQQTWARLLQEFPSIQTQFASARPVTPFHAQSKMPFRTTRTHGCGWVMTPAAVGFVDPIFSTGFPLTLLGLHRLADIFEKSIELADIQCELESYSRRTLEELRRVEQFAAALYASMGDFRKFSLLARAYFAAVIWAETRCRLDLIKAGAVSFLLGDLPESANQFDRLVAESSQWSYEKLRSEVETWVETIDLAGLNREERRNWIPVDADDLRRTAFKLGVSDSAIEQLLAYLGQRKPK